MRTRLHPERSLCLRAVVELFEAGRHRQGEIGRIEPAPAFERERELDQLDAQLVELTRSDCWSGRGHD